VSLIAKKDQELSYSSATEMLTAYNWDHSTGSRCEFHEEIGTKYCALAYTKRYAYLIADQLCQMFDIETEPGKHLPIEKSTSVAVPMSTSEFRSYNRKKRHDDVNQRYNDDYSMQSSVDIRYINSAPNLQSTSSKTTANNSFTKLSQSTAMQRKTVADKLMSIKSIEKPAESQSHFSSNYNDTDSERFALRSDNGFTFDDEDDDKGFQVVGSRANRNRMHQ
jgi:hypothetical protein